MSKNIFIEVNNLIEKKEINKAFANYILGFPNNYWYISLILSRASIDTFKILYTPYYRK